MRTWILTLSAAAFLASTLCAQQKPASQSATTSPSATPTVATAPQGKQAPVTPTPQSLAKAKELFGYDCVSCHGEKGNGKGDLAKDMGLSVPDFTDPATLKNTPDMTLFNVIHDGKGPMPEEGDRAKTDEIWNLVIYIRSLSQKPAVQGAAAAPVQTPAAAPALAPASAPAAH